MRTTLPWRLRVFEKFPTRPQMVELRKVSSEFPLPKVRESFTRQFADDDCISVQLPLEGKSFCKEFSFFFFFAVVSTLIIIFRQR